MLTVFSVESGKFETSGLDKRLKRWVSLPKVDCLLDVIGHYVFDWKTTQRRLLQNIKEKPLKHEPQTPRASAEFHDIDGLLRVEFARRMPIRQPPVDELRIGFGNERIVGAVKRDNFAAPVVDTLCFEEIVLELPDQ